MKDKTEFFTIYAFSFAGKLCEINIDECLSDPCQNQGTCVDGIAGYFCECPKGFTGELLDRGRGGTIWRGSGMQLSTL